MYLMKLREITKELVEKEILIQHYKIWILQHQHLRQVKIFRRLFLFLCVFPLEYIETCSFFHSVRN